MGGAKRGIPPRRRAVSAPGRCAVGLIGLQGETRTGQLEWAGQGGGAPRSTALSNPESGDAEDLASFMHDRYGRRTPAVCCRLHPYDGFEVQRLVFARISRNECRRVSTASDRLTRTFQPS